MWVHKDSPLQNFLDKWDHPIAVANGRRRKNLSQISKHAPRVHSVLGNYVKYFMTIHLLAST